MRIAFLPDDEIAAIVSAEDVARLEEYERRRSENFAFLEGIQQKLADVPADELEREVARAVRQVRSRLGAKQAAAGPSRPA